MKTVTASELLCGSIITVPTVHLQSLVSDLNRKWPTFNPEVELKCNGKKIKLSALENIEGLPVAYSVIVARIAKALGKGTRLFQKNKGMLRVENFKTSVPSPFRPVVDSRRTVIRPSYRPSLLVPLYVVVMNWLTEARFKALAEEASTRVSKAVIDPQIVTAMVLEDEAYIDQVYDLVDDVFSNLLAPIAVEIANDEECKRLFQQAYQFGIDKYLAKERAARDEYRKANEATKPPSNKAVMTKLKALSEEATKLGYVLIPMSDSKKV